VLLFSSSGGVSIETQQVHRFILDMQPDFTEFNQFLLTNQHPYHIGEVAHKLYSIFLNNDLLLCEVNPLVIVNDKPIVLDAKIEIDDNAQFRQKELFEKYDTRKISLNERELSARKIDENDLRGVAGKSYLDLDGDIAILASGGGASLAAMDILLDAGGKPANYAEYSGNPSREKVKKLTALTLSKENLAGCWIVGVIANFSDIYEAFQGIIDAVLELPELPKYPIVIRRAGPNDDKAHTFIQEIKQKYGLDIHFFDEKMSIGESAKEIFNRSNQFKGVQHAHLS
jgi:succinyl-CoA synthetase beta subunit